MPKYLTCVKYTAEGVRGLLQEGGTARRAAAERAIQAAGGTVESFHFAFGEYDAYVISDAPDNVSVAAVSMAVTATGVVSASTVVLLTPEEVDQVAKQATAYRGPGQAKKGKDKKQKKNSR